MNGSILDRKPLFVIYTNWQGQTRIRKLIVHNMLYTSNEWHPEQQWLLLAHDADDTNFRIKTFALKNCKFLGDISDEQLKLLERVPEITEQLCFMARTMPDNVLTEDCQLIENGFNALALLYPPSVIPVDPQKNEEFYK